MDDYFKGLRASSAERWINCPGSILACQGIESKSSPAAKKGIILHKKAADILNEAEKTIDSVVGKEDIMTKIHDEVFIKTLVDALVERFPERLTWEKEIKTYLEGCINRMISLRFKGCIPYIEKSLANGNLTGTPDFFYYNTLENEMVIADLKTGSRYVEVKNNFQLFTYLSLVIDFFMKNKTLREKMTADGIKIRLVIVQHEASYVSRIYHFGYRVFMELLETAIKKIEAKTTTRKAGTWCSFCPVKKECPQWNKLTGEGMQPYIA